MSNETRDIGEIEAILQRLNDFRLPRLLELKGRVDSGETMTEHDLQFLERIQEDARSIRSLVDRRPEVQPLYAEVTELYHEITTRGLENQSK